MALLPYTVLLHMAHSLSAMKRLYKGQRALTLKPFLVLDVTFSIYSCKTESQKSDVMSRGSHDKWTAEDSVKGLNI